MTRVPLALRWGEGRCIVAAGTPPSIARSALMLTLALVLTAGGCRRKPPAPEAPGVVVEPEDIMIVTLSEISAGPPISGSLEPGTEASILSELAGTVTAAPAREGEHVRAGTLLARISDITLPERRRSAEAAIASAEVAAENARRDVARMERLTAAGAVARREVETARGTLATAEAQLSAARAQLVDVIEDERASVVKSTITGVVSARLVSKGDVVQVGKELYRVVDPSTMMLEASLPAERLVGVKIGSPVRFEVRGYPGRTFRGQVVRINPTADRTTRQVTLHVTIPNRDGALIAGLFAEGVVTTASRATLVVPTAAIREVPAGTIGQGGETGTAKTTVEAEGRMYAMRIREGVADRTWVRTGIRDPRTDRVEILSGLARGDTVLVGPAMEIAPGTPVRVERLAAAAAPTH